MQEEAYYNTIKHYDGNTIKQYTYTLKSLIYLLRRLAKPPRIMYYWCILGVFLVYSWDHTHDFLYYVLYIIIIYYVLYLYSVLSHPAVCSIKAPTGRNYQVLVESKFPPRHVEAPTPPPGTY